MHRRSLVVALATCLLALPSLAKKVIAEFNLSPGAASKYRMAIRASHLMKQIPADVSDEDEATQSADEALRCA